MSRGRLRRILYNELNEDGTVGGSHQCLYDLVRHLDRGRFDPVVLFYQSNPFVERMEALGVEVHTWEGERRRERVTEGPFRRPRLAARMIGAIERRAGFIRRERIDLVHLNNSPIRTAEDWLPAARITRRPVISHCRAEVRPEDGRVRRWLSGRFDRVIAISRNVAESLRRAGVTSARISQVYDGIDAESLAGRVRTDPGQVRSALSVPREAFLIVMAGHLRSWKGQHVLLRALHEIDEQDRSRMRAVFAGDVDRLEPSYADTLRRYVAEHGLEPHVTFLGPRDDVPDLMSAADAVVHASVIPEPLGLVVLEGMTLGKAVIASRLGGPSETIAPGSGLLFDPTRPQELAAHLRRLAADPALRHALGAAGRERARSFGIEANVRAIQTIYEELLG